MLQLLVSVCSVCAVCVCVCGGGGCTVQCAGTRLVYAVHQILPSLPEVGLACETI